MTSALHLLPGMDDYQSRLQLAELDNVVHSTAAAANLAENYVGFQLPAEALSAPWSELADGRGPVLKGTP
jgi:p-hydroxybenzoate 3-monooxygenase